MRRTFLSSVLAMAALVIAGAHPLAQAGGGQSAARPPGAAAPTAARAAWTPPASSIKTVYVVPSSHYDFGFVDPPDAVRERGARHLDRVLALAEKDPSFRWTIESVWQVNEWLKRAKTPASVLPLDERRVQSLVGKIKSGQIALSMAWGSMHTDFMGVEPLNRLVYGFSALQRTYGVSSDFAMMDDVPGHPASIPSVLAASGVKHALIGVNQGLGGGTSLSPGKVPFYWEGPDGGRVLTWISQSVRGGYPEGLADYYLDPFTRDPYTDKPEYEMFHPGQPAKAPLAIMEEGVTELLNRYGKAGYAYDSVLVMYVHDFLEPDNAATNLPRAVALWNRSHKTPQLRIATPTEFFAHMEQAYGDRLAVYRGEWSGLWSEAKTSSPRISALARAGQDEIPIAETLWSAIAAMTTIPHPVGSVASLLDWLFTYDEHSGAGNTGWPGLNTRTGLEEQNRQYVRDMTRLQEETSRLIDTGLDILAEPGGARASEAVRTLVVYNPSSWTRTDLVEVDPPGRDTPSDTQEPIAAVTRDGQDVPFDVLPDSRVAFIARDVPPLGYVTFTVRTGRDAATPTLAPIAGNAIDSSHYRVRLTPTGDIASLVDVSSGRELANANGLLPFNHLQWIRGNDPAALPQPAPVRVTAERGRVLQRLVVERPRAAFAKTVITVYRDLDRVDIRNEVDGDRVPFAGGRESWHDAYYFAFPFALDPAALQVRFEGQRGFTRVPDDYLPGARQDAVTSQHVLALTDPKSTVLLAHRQAFHFTFAGFLDVKSSEPLPNGQKKFPAMFTGKWPLPEATVYSKAFRAGNQADTHDLGVVNFDTVEPGLPSRAVFEYAVASADGAFDAVRASRFGAAANVPLRARYLDVPPARATWTFLQVDQDNVQILTVKPRVPEPSTGMVTSVPLVPSPTRKFIVRLQEIAGAKQTTVRLTTPLAIARASLLTLTEDRVLRPDLPRDPLTVTLGPYEVATVAIDLEAKPHVP